MGADQWDVGVLLAAAGIGAVVGLLIGQAKRRVFAGVVLGLLAGPLGWLITALLPVGVDPKTAPCPFCLNRMPMHQTECANCNRRVVWVANKPRKPSGPGVAIGQQ